MKKVNIGVIGCGKISSIYLKNLKSLFKITEVVACADLIEERAKKQAEEFNIPKVYTVDEMLSDPNIQIVLNLTIPKAHAEINIKALNANKNVYVEKPFAVTRKEGLEVLKLADEKNLLVGCAPDTFMGAGIQTCIKLINDGWIGNPVAATAFLTCHGHENWHPDPEFYYEVGGGPMFDMGPYYLTALISMLGPVNKVSGMTKISFPKRTITSEKKFGKIINVEVPTHISGLLEFNSGVIANIITSFDIWNSNLPRIEIYGSQGTLSVPDPNTFGGNVMLRRQGTSEWKEIPYSHVYADNSRGIGLADMAYSILSNREHRANAKLAYHVLDIMHGFHDSSDSEKHYIINSTCQKPTPLPTGLIEGFLDL